MNSREVLRHPFPALRQFVLVTHVDRDKLRWVNTRTVGGVSVKDTEIVMTFMAPPRVALLYGCSLVIDDRIVKLGGITIAAYSPASNSISARMSFGDPAVFDRAINTYLLT